MKDFSNIFSVLSLDVEDDKDQTAVSASADSRKKSGKKKSVKGQTPEADGDCPSGEGSSERFRSPLVWIDLEMTGSLPPDIAWLEHIRICSSCCHQVLLSWRAEHGEEPNGSLPLACLSRGNLGHRDVARRREGGLPHYGEREEPGCAFWFCGVKPFTFSHGNSVFHVKNDHNNLTLDGSSRSIYNPVAFLIDILCFRWRKPVV